MKTLDSSIDKIVMTLDVTTGRSASMETYFYDGAKVIANSTTQAAGPDAFARVGVELDSKWEMYNDGKLVNTFNGTKINPYLFIVTFSTNSPSKVYVLRKVV